MHWELEELERALAEGDVQLAKRYASKLHAYLFCPSGAGCGQPIRYEVKDAEPFFKGYKHKDC